MTLRVAHIRGRMATAWKRTVKGDIILLRAGAPDANGPLNAARVCGYTPIVIHGCDILMDGLKKRETREGVDEGAAAVVYIHNSRLGGVEIAPTDRINIGGTMDGGTVTGGREFLIVDVAATDFFYDDAEGIKITLGDAS